MDCKTAHDLLPLYFDGELDRATSREFEAHLDACADCRAALVELDELRRSLREHAPRYTAPAALRERIAGAVEDTRRLAAPSSSATRRWSRTLSTPLRYAAALAIAFAGGGISMHLWNGTQGDSTHNQIARDLFASHWRALAASSPVDVVSSDRHTVKPWFAGKVADAPLVQDFAEQGFPLAGGRIDYVGMARVPVLVYRHGSHLIDVFVLGAEHRLTADDMRMAHGSTLQTVDLAGQPAAIVTDMDAQETAAFKKLLEQHK